MPEMNGLEAMAEIGNEFPEAKIIILTTYGSDAQGAMKLGARAYLLKTQLNNATDTRCRGLIKSYQRIMQFGKEV